MSARRSRPAALDVSIQGVGCATPSVWPLTERGWAWALDTFELPPRRARRAPAIGIDSGDVATVVESAQGAGIKIEVLRIGSEEGGCS